MAQARKSKSAGSVRDDEIDRPKAAPDLSKFAVKDASAPKGADAAEKNEASAEDQAGADAADEVSAPSASKPASAEKSAKEPAEQRPAAARDTKAGSGTAAPTSSAAATAPTRKRGARTLAWILAALLVIAGLGLLEQGQRIGTLESQLVALSGELDRSRLEVARHRGRMDQVRSEVADLLVRLEGLSALVSEDAAAPSAPAEGD